MANPLLILLLFLSFSSFSFGDPCRKTTTLTGFESHLISLQHQLRGVLTILDGCSFTVRSFDMLSGSNKTFWWASAGDDLTNLTRGFPASEQLLNHTYNSEKITFQLADNVSWDQIVVLAVWDMSTASDFGHVWLRNFTDEVEEPANVLDNCVSLSHEYHVRWSLNSDLVSIGLEAAVGSGYYMAFGWAKPGSGPNYMYNSDIVIAGFTEEGMPFADDYFISKNSECVLNKDGKVEGVCPDALLDKGSNSAASVNNTKMVYGHRRDGVSFIRYERPLVSVDEKYDLSVNKTDSMMVIWALGMMHSKDAALGSYYLPKGHGGPANTSFGFLTLNLSMQVNDCIGPLDAKDKEDQDFIIADGKNSLIVSSGRAKNYPNPPSPSNVIYINKKESPLLQVKRGVPVTFSIQAGDDVGLYITSDPLGGNATARNLTEVVYAGGPQFQGIQDNPMELVWLPDHNTPDQVYYQSVFEQKMGWKIKVVDGGLSEMYNNSVLLDNKQVSLFWTLSGDSVSFAARGEKKSGFLAIGFGNGMINSYAYVGWIDEKGKGRVDTYWIDGKNAISIHPTSENLTSARCSSENGVITFEFVRPLLPSCSGKKECENKIDPATTLNVVWAMGAQWVEENLSSKNMHSETSNRPVEVFLSQGSSKAGKDLRPILAVHGFMMFVAWGILFPGGILAARYMKHVKGDSWFRIHVYFQYSGIAVMLLGVIFAAAELGGFYVSTRHVKFGVAALIFAFIQPMNAYVRPKKPATGEIASTKRVLWEYFHTYVGRSAVVVGVVAIFSGLKHLEHHYGSEIKGPTVALILWILAVAILALYLEYLEVKRRRNERISVNSSWVLGDSDEDDDLLHPNSTTLKSEVHLSDSTEVQLQPLSR